MRGGLLTSVPRYFDHMNTLHLFANMSNKEDLMIIPYADTIASLDVMKDELRKDNIVFFKPSVRFEYHAEWHPECLIIDSYKGLPLSHAIVQFDDLEFYTVSFQTALKHEAPSKLFRNANSKGRFRKDSI